MTVTKTPVFPAPREEVFRLLRKTDTPAYITGPFAPAGEAADAWEAGSISGYRLKRFGVFSFGIRTIHIPRFDPDGVRSREGNGITRVPLDAGHTEYTDRVEIRAGWKTVPVRLWARAFCARRQRRWRRLLRGEGCFGMDGERSRV